MVKDGRPSPACQAALARPSLLRLKLGIKIPRFPEGWCRQQAMILHVLDLPCPLWTRARRAVYGNNINAADNHSAASALPCVYRLYGLQLPVLLCAVPRLVATVGFEPTCPVPHCSVGLPHQSVCRLPITGTLHHKKCRRISSAVWCTRQESNLQSFRKSAFEAAAYAGFATGAYKCTGHVADHGRCSRKGCSRLLMPPSAGAAR